ncbi:MAG: ribose-phosphate diphosphokinase [Candidatus Micrarchaeota archaeon]
MFVIACSNGKVIGKKLASKLNANYSELWKEYFPDGELHLKFKVKVAGNVVVIVQSLSPEPNESLIEFVFAIKTAKELGARKVIAVAPYLCYARQDKRFHHGEVVGNHIVSHLIQHAGADEFYTVAAHLHRIASIYELFSIKSANLSMPEEIANWVKKKFKNGAIIVGPDIESHRVGEAVAKLAGSNYDTFLKKRFSGTRVKHTAVANVECRGKDVVIIDDIISTGGTILGAAKHLKKMGAKSVSAVCIHLMTQAAGDKLRANGIKYVASSNTIPSKYAVLDASKAIAKGINHT